MPRCPRLSIRHLFVLACSPLLAGMLCSAGGYYVEPEVAFVPADECVGFDCPLALGAEMTLRTGYASDVLELVTPEGYELVPEGVVEVLDVANGTMRIRGISEGTTQLTVFFEHGKVVSKVRVAPAASTQIIPVATAGLDLLSPGDDFAAFEGSSVELFAQHRGIGGQALVGEGVDDWELLGDSSAVMVSPGSDAKMWSYSPYWELRAGAASETAEVHAGLEASTDVQFIGPEEVGMLGALVVGSPDVVDRGATLTVPASVPYPAIHVAAYTSLGTYIVGASDSDFEILTAPEAVAELHSVSPHNRTITLHPVASGTDTLRVRVGAQVAEFAIAVP